MDKPAFFSKLQPQKPEKEEVQFRKTTKKVRKVKNRGKLIEFVFSAIQSVTCTGPNVNKVFLRPWARRQHYFLLQPYFI